VQTPTDYASTSAAASWAAKILTLLILAIVLCQITACGGGGDDGLDVVPTPSVDCKANPELCK